MRLFDFLDSYTILKENVLSTEFTWGFELEGVCTTPKTRDHYVPVYHPEANQRRGEDKPKGTALELQNDLDELLGNHGRIQSDSSLRASSDRGGWTFEYASGVFQTFDPHEFIHIVDALKNGLPRLNVYTNDSCGFHTHISYKQITKQDAAWIICCIAIDEKLKKELTGLDYGDEHVDFFGRYADKQYYERIKSGLEDKNYAAVNSILNDSSSEKMRNVRIHPHGTLEWRGPRGFLQSEKLIKEYAKKLYRVIIQIGKIADSKTWKGDNVTIDRKEIDENIKVDLKFDSKLEQRKLLKDAQFIEAIKKHPLILASLRGKQIEDILTNGPFLKTLFDNISSDDAIQLWNRLNDKVRYHYLEKIKESSGQALESFMNVLKDKEYTLPDNYIPLFYTMSNFIEVFGNHLNGVPLVLIKDFKKFFDEKGVRKYIMDHSDEIPMEAWNYLLKPEFWRLLPRLDMPVKIQRKFVKKNPYNVQYIRNPDSSVIETLKKQIPDIEQYIARYYK